MSAQRSQRKVQAAAATGWGEANGRREAWADCSAASALAQEEMNDSAQSSGGNRYTYKYIHCSALVMFIHD
jgi:hypothetical protein